MKAIVKALVGPFVNAFRESSKNLANGTTSSFVSALLNVFVGSLPMFWWVWWLDL